MVICSISASATLFAVIVAISNAITALFSYLLSAHKTKHDKDAKKQEKIDAANKELEDVCNNGSLSDLLDISKKIGDAKK